MDSTRFDQEMQAALNTFIAEALELLQYMENDLLHLEQYPDAEVTATIFRSMHTIKGSAGLFGLTPIVQFAHAFESVLEVIRAGNLTFSTELVALLLPCRDYLAKLIHALAEGRSAYEQHAQQGDALLNQLRTYVTLPQASQSTPTVPTGNWHISMRFGLDALRNGMDPLSFIRYLGTLGTIITLTTLTDSLPSASDMDPESCYLGFELDLHSTVSKATLEEVFEFVREDSLIKILPPDSCVAAYIELIRSLPEGEHRLGEILINSGVLTERELRLGLQQQYQQKQSAVEEDRLPIGAILVAKQAVPQPLVDAALEKQQQAKDNKARENQHIRVDADKLDKLLDLVGELSIACASAQAQVSQLKHPTLLETHTQITHLLAALRDNALKLRMIPIAATFNRFSRVVRDTCAELSKDIALVIEGADTEVDKALIEHISDPLLHLVRNAMDHGIESVPLRLARGKPAQGTVKLNAYHESGSVIIAVSDDGGGLQRDKILAKALERGFITQDMPLSDADIHALLFEPGFSTAEQISNLSGRGVGMDVVKQNIVALRGTIEIISQPEQGTTVKIHLPLTLAMIDGFLVRIGQGFFVLPQEYIIECLTLSNTAQAHYLSLRGEVLPFVELAQVFGLPHTRNQRGNALIVQVATQKAALVVDELMGELQAVIKPLGQLFAHVQGIGGFTILGNGAIALLLDLPVLMRYYGQRDLADTRSVLSTAPLELHQPSVC